jgi:hypothetical protein
LGFQQADPNRATTDVCDDEDDDNDDDDYNDNDEKNVNFFCFMSATKKTFGLNLREQFPLRMQCGPH